VCFIEKFIDVLSNDSFSAIVCSNVYIIDIHYQFCCKLSRYNRYVMKKIIMITMLVLAILISTQTQSFAIHEGTQHKPTQLIDNCGLGQNKSCIATVAANGTIIITPGIPPPVPVQQSLKTEIVEEVTTDEGEEEGGPVVPRQPSGNGNDNGNGREESDNPYCDQNDQVECFDRKDYDQETGLYPCRDGSQVGDWKDNLHYPLNGVFVDVGASDGVYGNNTYFFEKIGWRGLCIDADPSHRASLQANRGLVESCAVSSVRGEVEFYRHNTNSTWSGIYQRGEDYTPIKIQSRTLEDLLVLHDIDKIDLLDIDVEGSEIDVWNSFNPELYQPEVVIIEYSESRQCCNKTEIISVITEYPYNLAYTTSANLIFVRTPSDWIHSKI
jgi:FkbM family methyltransferase